MDVRLASLIEGAREAEGTVVIIDVFRAFTTAAVAFSRGASRIILVAEIDEALALRDKGVGEICMGEVDGIRPEGFDFGNSPFELSTADVDGKTIVQSTRAGTVGAAAALKARQMYACSLVIAGATARRLLIEDPPVVTVVAMGAEGKRRSDEDEQCALYLRNLLQGRTPDRGAVQRLAAAGSDATKYDDPSLPHYHPMDREIALRVDSMPFAIEVSRHDGLLVALASPC